MMVSTTGRFDQHLVTLHVQVRMALIYIPTIDLAKVTLINSILCNFLSYCC